MKGCSHYLPLLLVASIPPLVLPAILTFPLSASDPNIYSYTASIPIGTPPQLLPLTVSTGSTFMIANCMGCTDYNCKGAVLYNPTASSTAQSIPCNSSLCSAAGSQVCPSNSTPCPFATSGPTGSIVAGTLVSDVLGEAPWRVITGCAIRNNLLDDITSLPASQTPNISSGSVGLIATNAFRQNPLPPLLVNLWKSGALDSLAFTLCLLPPSGEAGASGALLLGDSTGGGARGVQWVNLSTPSAFYTPYLMDAILDGNTSLCAPYMTSGRGCVALNTPLAIIDTSTQFSYLPTPLYRALLLNFAAWCTWKPGRCVGQVARMPNEGPCYTSPQLDTFPTLTLPMAVTPPYSSFFSPSSFSSSSPSLATTTTVNLTFPLFPPIISPWNQGNPPVWCLAVYDNGAGGTVIGAHALVNATLIFDAGGGRLGVSNDTTPCHATPTPPPPPSASSTPSLSPSPPPSPGESPSPTLTPTPSPTPSPQSFPPAPDSAGGSTHLLWAAGAGAGSVVVLGVGGAVAAWWWWWRRRRREGGGRWAGSDDSEWSQPNPASASSVPSVRGDVLSVWKTAAEGGAGSAAAAARAAALKETLLLRGGVPLPPRPEE